MENDYLSKKELVKILEQFNIPINEGISADKILSDGIYPKLVFWAYHHDFVVASNDALKVVDTYQVSIFTDDDNFFKKMLPVLKNNKLFPTVEQEYLNEYNCWHFYFPIDVVEEITDEK